MLWSISKADHPGKVQTMSQIVWNADKGWHDDGEIVNVSLDEKGRLTSSPIHEYSTVWGGEKWCDTHDSAYPCTVEDDA
jgi:hypothetical protein